MVWMQLSVPSKINNKKFIPQPNKMGIKEFSLSFDVDGGKFSYLNEQGNILYCVNAAEVLDLQKMAL